MVLFVFCLIIFAGILYNFVKYRKDDESARIYGIFSFVSYLSVVVSGARVIPVGIFDTEMKAGIFMAVIFISVIALALVFLPKTGKNAMKGAVMITAVCLAVVMMPLKENLLDNTNKEGISDPQAFQEAYDRAYTASLYAEDNLVNELGVNKDSITKGSYGFVPGEEMEYFAAFAWNDENGNENKYGYKISVNDEYECMIIESGQDIGTDAL